MITYTTKNMKKRNKVCKRILDNNCECLVYITLNEKYDIGASFLNIMQLKSSIPIEWKESLKQCSQMPKNIPSGNTIKINNTIKTIETVTCKELYWHLMNTDPHTPIAVQKWSSHYPTFNEACTNLWPRIF